MREGRSRFFGRSTPWHAVNEHVLRHYPQARPIDDVDALGSAGGYSGALFWRLRSRLGVLCLRAWPNRSPDAQRLAWIHAVMAWLESAHGHLIPTPLKTVEGLTWVRWENRFWELSFWARGQADYEHNPNPDRLRSALRTLAELHRSAARVPTCPPQFTLSPSIEQRQFLLHKVDEGLLERVVRASREPNAPAELVDRVRSMAALFKALAPELIPRVDARVSIECELQVCHGDLWHDHVLFTGDQVTGIVDFGAMKRESCTTDIARLLGSLVRDDRDGWQTGLDAYQQIRPLTPIERELVILFDQTTVMLSGFNWLRWLLLEHRTFEQHERIYRRLDAIIARLKSMRDGQQGSWGIG